MKHWKERILQMKFGKLVKRLTVLSICVVLLEGILSVVLLQPQISQIASAVQQTEQMDGFWEDHFRDWENWDGEGWDDAIGITEPTLPVKGALLGIGAVFCVLFAVWWPGAGVALPGLQTGPDECAAVAAPGADLEPVGTVPVSCYPQSPASAVQFLRRLAAESILLPGLWSELPCVLSFLWGGLQPRRPILRPLRIVPEACGRFQNHR